MDCQCDVKVTERGWGGHFFLCRKCLFRRNTLIEYKDVRWVVSTVGAMQSEEEPQTIGNCTYYETMVFEAKAEDNIYYDADVTKPVNGFNSNSVLRAPSWKELEEKYPNPDVWANEMHETIVQEAKEKITGKYTCCDNCVYCYNNELLKVHRCNRWNREVTEKELFDSYCNRFLKKECESDDSF